MTAQADMLARMRELLADTTIPQTWSDLTLRQALTNGIVEYSVLFPRHVRLLLNTTDGQTSADVEAALQSQAGPYDAGRRLLAVYRVECPARRVLRQTKFTPVTPGAEARPYQQSWHMVETQLVFRRALAGAEVGTQQLVVGATATWYYFTVDAADPIASADWDLPAYDRGLVVWLAVRDAWRQLALLGVATGADADPGAQIARLDAQIAAALDARRRRPAARRLGLD
jgi:hypothetical protein